ncbi:alpha-1,2-fucosyltransferase [Georgenia muralis]|uniref:Glycosyl transferase family 11 n=1 Tax=Georgenia muralis TaxID=154117 RepID=A0A3N4YYZ6_9MICO|nr:alpha-1,2-fucosyltransferase [Georgenia muralis]RPF26389.1 glycosyl transferase family 11 [Georgenia muralis]
MGFGNFLYLLFDAHRRRSLGDGYRVLRPRAMEPWLTAFPALRPLSIDRTEMGRCDRQLGWGFELHNRFGLDFNREQLQAFVRSTLIAGLSGRVGDGEENTVTLNIRRGDYYAVPYFRGTHSMDTPAYIEVALDEAIRTGGRATSLVVVSDGLDWCRSRLDGLLHSFAPSVLYAEGSPLENFRTVATARRLIGTNSTFSYWGAYVNDVLHGPTAQVIMPRFHARVGNDHRAYQLDPRWTIIEDIPGGWNS